MKSVYTLSLPIFFLLFFILFNQLIFSQTDSSLINSEEAIDDILQESTEEIENDELYEVFENLIRNPININKANLDQLQRVPFIDLAAAKSIINYREKFGTFFSVNELYSIEGFDDQLVKKILPFILVTDEIKNLQSENVSANKIIQNSKIYFRSRIATDLQTEKGFSENKYLGTQPKIYNRLLLNYNNHFQAGILTDKDVGEKSLYDFYSFHFAVKDYGILETFVAGDYLIEFGQGLALWSPYGLSKGAEAVYPLKEKRTQYKKLYQQYGK